MYTWTNLLLCYDVCYGYTDKMYGLLYQLFDEVKVFHAFLMNFKNFNNTALSGYVNFVDFWHLLVICANCQIVIWHRAIKITSKGDLRKVSPEYKEPKDNWSLLRLIDLLWLKTKKWKTFRLSFQVHLRLDGNSFSLGDSSQCAASWTLIIETRHRKS